MSPQRGDATETILLQVARTSIIISKTLFLGITIAGYRKNGSEDVDAPKYAFAPPLNSASLNT